MSIGNREYWLVPDERCEILRSGDTVLIQHQTIQDWVYTAVVRKEVSIGQSVIVALEEELNSPANWKVRCKL